MPRNTTTLVTFRNGMYLTEQTVPEGYARVMVNYDIDDTGNHIRPRPGFDLLKVIDLPNPMQASELHFMDYLYVYEANGETVESLKDVLLSFGDGYYANNDSYHSAATTVTDNNVYELIDDNWEIIVPGDIVTTESLDSWGILYKEGTKDNFQLIDTSELGICLARNITNAYSFNERFLNQSLFSPDDETRDMYPDLKYPIYTVMNNELYAIANPKPTYYNYTFNAERNYNTFTERVLSKLKIIHNTDDTYKLVPEQVTLKDLSPLEAATTGFNMLSPNPYLFSDIPGSSTVDILGMLYYKSKIETTPLFTATIGSPVWLRVYYEYLENSSLEYKIEVLDLTNQAAVANSEWELLQDFTAINAGEELWYEYTPQTVSTVIRVTMRIAGTSATEDVQTLNVYCGATKYDKFQAKTFNLNECKGMITWLGRVGVYGVKGAEDTIFFSDIENAGYFPYPNNILTFETDILAVHNYLDNILVFTVDAVWIVTAGTSISTSTQKKILENTNITELDSLHVQVLKQEIFFKMNDQFYVLKPNKYTTDITDLKSYLNSTAISNFTQNFKKSMLDILEKTYPRYVGRTDATNHFLSETDVPINHFPPTINGITKRRHYKEVYLRNMYSQIVNAEVHYMYKMNCTYDINPIGEAQLGVDFFCLHIIYNTLTRSWRLYIQAAEAARGNAAIAPLLYQNKVTNEVYKVLPIHHLKPHQELAPDFVQLLILKQNSSNADDSLVWITNEQDEFVRFDKISNVLSNEAEQGMFVPIFSNNYNNHTYLDTGTIAIDTAFTKRYREVQISLLNLEKASIPFKTYFQLDGKEQLEATQYNVYHVTDESLEDYGNVYITPLEMNNTMLYGDTTLQLDTDYLGYSESWTIDNSKFPTLTPVNVRIELLGRGRRASLQLLNTSLKRYELADVVWVYRTMSAR